ncbi:MAG TPA: glutathione S-transferase family protein [Aestuariivirga sp.]|nr:glutathione S-transferase family protein [Aestuariivirga sp.]
MAQDLVFYTNPMSRGRIVRWMLEEIGAPYETKNLNYGAEMKSAAYRAINPMGKVPAIVHHGVVVTEQAAICTYLADAFPAAGLAPAPGDPARGDYYRWLFFTAGPIEQAVVNHSLGVAIPDDKRGMVGYGSYDLALKTLEQALAGRSHLAGSRFSAADLYLASHIQWGLMTGTMPDRPAFRAYSEPLLARPAKVRADGLDNALVAQAP